MIRCVLAGLVGLAVASCNGDEPGPAFPENYAAIYTEVRDCRNSGDHDLNVIRVLASPEALAPYRDRDQPFPIGAVVIKEEYDFGDTSCSGAIKQWTVMERVSDDGSGAELGWRWQRVDSERNVLGEDEARCYGCHAGCTPAMGGYEGTCTVP